MSRVGRGTIGRMQNRRLPAEASRQSRVSSMKVDGCVRGRLVPLQRGPVAIAVVRLVVPIRLRALIHLCRRPGVHVLPRGGGPVLSPRFFFCFPPPLALFPPFARGGGCPPRGGGAPPGVE